MTNDNESAVTRDFLREGRRGGGLASRAEGVVVRRVAECFDNTVLFRIYFRNASGYCAL
jgi:hypothetical protein